MFGDYISIYDIHRAVADKATVPIYYESRIAKLGLNAAALPKIDEEFDEITEGAELTSREKLKTKWAAPAGSVSGAIPLNSPLHYPRFNGAIEYAQRELKAAAALAGQGVNLPAALETAPRLLNAKPRPVLAGRTAAAVFLPSRAPFQQQFTPRKRKEIKNSIEENAERILMRMRTCGHHAHDAAWRQAVQQWLVQLGFITVLQPKSVSPLFP